MGHEPLPLRLTPKAQEDLEAIWRYSFEKWGAAQADRYLDGFSTSFATLCDMPAIGRLRTEFTPPVRIYHSGEHLVFYRTDQTTLLVLRILHPRRNWHDLLGET
ncbi:type II toxin-antitoxin system RelE/ParE family toxin [Arenibacterium halophilum]|uniref:Toxin n=1 Tax=Arenibacterium halophilum TaxID=2583821 RepID=A0ABY2XEA0_9RHOB|nr:type II toxin-antitoxin system RelE/ParE family toxin [Arenibacterium halophilum]TMV15354.1 type II toxin-antitoxin system RelE/ParE family toxin [Arenibacterium halophilum]